MLVVKVVLGAVVLELFGYCNKSHALDQNLANSFNTLQQHMFYDVLLL